jgi:hypothetical protein
LIFSKPICCLFTLMIMINIRQQIEKESLFWGADLEE